jgi:hypothetical protein
VWSLVSTYLNESEAINNLDQDTFDAASLTALLGGPPSIGSITSASQWASSGSPPEGMQQGVTLVGNDVVLTAVTDPSGDFEVLFPIASSFDTKHLTLKLVEPLSGLALGQVAVSVSDATASVPVSISPLQSTFPDRPASYTQNSCGDTVAFWTGQLLFWQRTYQSAISISIRTEGGASVAELQRGLIGSINDVLFDEQAELKQNGCWEQLSIVQTSKPKWP